MGDGLKNERKLCEIHLENNQNYKFYSIPSTRLTDAAISISSKFKHVQRSIFVRALSHSIQLARSQLKLNCAKVKIKRPFFFIAFKLQFAMNRCMIDWLDVLNVCWQTSNESACRL